MLLYCLDNSLALCDNIPNLRALHRLRINRNRLHTTMAITLSNYQEVLIGIRDGQKIYLSPPSWDCGWYWGFGYLGNNNCHYHVDGLTTHEWHDTEKACFQSERLNLFDGFRKHFGDSFKITDGDLWTLCELFQTFYTLKTTAEVLGRGGSHYTTNPCADLIKNVDETTRINEVVLPQVFEEIYKVLHNATRRFTEAENAKNAKESERLQAEIARLEAKKAAIPVEYATLPMVGA